MAGESNESGIMVYPRMPVPSERRPDRPAERRGEPRQPRGGMSGGRIAVFAVAVIAGGAGGWFVRPVIAPDARIAGADGRARTAEAAAAAQKSRADALDKSLDAATKDKADTLARLTVAEAAAAELAGKTANDSNQQKAVQAIGAKLRATRAGTVAIDGGEVHLQISDRVLFKPNDDALTDRGKAVLNKVAAALKELPDKPVWVQGHTDAQPVALPKLPPPTPPAPLKKGAKPAAAVVLPPLRFPTNWELSAARALAVVRYFQDVARLDPSRLAALAFGQYAPTSKKDSSLNRRLEIVVGGKRPAS